MIFELKRRQKSFRKKRIEFLPPFSSPFSSVSIFCSSFSASAFWTRFLDVLLPRTRLMGAKNCGMSHPSVPVSASNGQSSKVRWVDHQQGASSTSIDVGCGPSQEGVTEPSHVHHKSHKKKRRKSRHRHHRRRDHNDHNYHEHRRGRQTLRDIQPSHYEDWYLSQVAHDHNYGHYSGMVPDSTEPFAYPPPQPWMRPPSYFYPQQPITPHFNPNYPGAVPADVYNYPTNCQPPYTPLYPAQFGHQVPMENVQTFPQVQAEVTAPVFIPPPVPDISQNLFDFTSMRTDPVEVPQQEAVVERSVLTPMSDPQKKIVSPEDLYSRVKKTRRPQKRASPPSTPVLTSCGEEDEQCDMSSKATPTSSRNKKRSKSSNVQKVKKVNLFEEKDELSEFYSEQQVPVPCERCQNIFHTPVELYTHSPCLTAEVHKSKSGKPKSVYNCRFPDCREKSKSRKSMKDHIRTHCPTVFECQICQEFTATSLFDVRTHVAGCLNAERPEKKRRGKEACFPSHVDPCRRKARNVVKFSRQTKNFALIRWRSTDELGVSKKQRHSQELH